jgi:hypothetical protein
MRAWKKLAGLALALAVVMSLTVPAWAAPGDLLTGTYNDNTFTEIDGTSFTVTITNDGTVTGYKENNSVTYTIKNADGSATLTDGAVYFTNGTGGTNGAKNTYTVNYSASQIAATADAATVSLSFDKTMLTRVTDKNYCKYKIAGNDGTTYDLYIYVKTDGAPYAAILVDDADSTFDPEAESGSGAATANATLKKSGFAPTFTASPVGSVTISKSVTGTGANTDTAFPFSIIVEFPQIDGATNSWTYPVTLSESGDNNTTNASCDVTNIAYTYTDADNHSQQFTAYLGDGDSITIADLPYDAVVYVRETYGGGDYGITSTVSGMGSSDNISTSVTSDSLNETDSKPVTRGTVNGASATIEFTNTRDAISPTGVVLRFAPYLAMLGAGLTTMVIAPRRKEEE